ncbi:HAD-IB family hydrolase [Legionella sp. PATHC038]|uniref:HAD-IB family hydrolase n=1 Tax=Legionella sheltonii TaxID=2992041 RepID=UPI002243B16A|nr:HAD-IB family hydrolase [Legionella sp. PATHC038]MCW8398017.1 HAD-IB family hydrolase [Legionella sp. PATHC038]
MTPYENNQINHVDTVAIFDFDGTITYKNTTIPFLRFIEEKHFFWKFLPKVPHALAYKLHLIDVDGLNNIIATHFLKDLSQEFLYQSGENFVDSILPQLIKDSAIQRLKWHKERGHHCILATSAYNLYVDYWGKQNGFDHIVSTQIDFDPQGKATGKLRGKSCNGQEKLRRVLECINNPKTLYAYGDSNGDKEILNYATHPYYRRFN